MLLRNGEQLLLTVIIPSLLLVLFSHRRHRRHRAARRVRRLPGPRRPRARRDVDRVHRQAIATGFERRYGVLKRLGASPLPRWAPDDRQDAVGAGHRGPPDRAADRDRLRAGLVPARQPASPCSLLLLLGTAAFSGLGLLMAGHAEGGGDPGRREPGLPAAAGRRRRDRAAGQVPGRRPRACSGCCRSRRCPTGCATCSSTAPACRGATSAILAVWAVARAGRRGAVLPLGVSRPGTRSGDAVRSCDAPLVKACTSGRLRWLPCRTDPRRSP